MSVVLNLDEFENHRPTFGRWIDIPDAKGGRLRLHALWLRDNCPCNECRHEVTNERILFSAGIPAQIRAQSIRLDERGDLEVTWPERGGVHKSVYTMEWMAQYATAHRMATLLPETARPWTSHTFKMEQITWEAIMDDDRAVLQWCNAMVSDGVASIVDVPARDGEVERVATRIAHVRETGYDRLHEVRSEPDPYNVASTSVELKTHTDMPNYSSPPGIQLLHFVQNDATGGETTLTDGFAVAQDIAMSAPETFRVLCETPVSFRMTSKKCDVVGHSRLVTLDPHGTIELVRFSNQLMQPVQIPNAQIDNFYDAYRHYSHQMVSPHYMAKFRCKPGTIISTHNHRVLHGRASFNPGSGARHLQLTYMDFDDVLSRARLIRKAQGS